MTRSAALLALALAACGDDPVAPPPPLVLNVSAHTEALHEWGNGVAADDVGWRLISVTSEGLRGAYNMRWVNGTPSGVEISYELRFYDASGFELDRYPPVFSISQSVPAFDERAASGNFTLPDVTSIEAANEIARMQIWASFVFPAP